MISTFAGPSMAAGCSCMTLKKKNCHKTITDQAKMNSIKDSDTSFVLLRSSWF